MDTINRLLRKQPPKRRGRASAIEGAEGTPAEQEQAEVEKADPTLTRWVSRREGFITAVPEEWLGTPTGHMFGTDPVGANRARKLVEEV